MKVSKFDFNYVHFVYYKYHKINPISGGPYIYAPDWIKSKKVTINLINKKDNKCFQRVVTVALSHKELKKDPQRITRFKPFFNKYIWEEIIFISKRDDWKNSHKNNITIAPMFCMLKREKYILLTFQKVNSNRKTQVILLLIPNGEEWHYLE